MKNYVFTRLVTQGQLFSGVVLDVMTFSYRLKIMYLPALWPKVNFLVG